MSQGIRRRYRRTKAAAELAAQQTAPSSQLRAFDVLVDASILIRAYASGLPFEQTGYTATDARATASQLDALAQLDTITTTDTAPDANAEPGR